MCSPLCHIPAHRHLSIAAFVLRIVSTRQPRGGGQPEPATRASKPQKNIGKQEQQNKKKRNYRAHRENERGTFIVVGRRSSILRCSLSSASLLRRLGAALLRNVRLRHRAGRLERLRVLRDARVGLLPHGRLEERRLVRPPRVPELHDERALVVLVMLAERLGDERRHLLGAVEGRAGEDVVHDVGVGDVVGQVVPQRAVVAVDGGDGTLDEVEVVLLVVMRHARVGVLQERDEHKPRVRADPPEAVVRGDGPRAELHRRDREHAEHHEHADVGEDHAEAVTLLEHRSVRVEVVLRRLVAVALEVEADVQRPADEQVHGDQEEVQRRERLARVVERRRVVLGREGGVELLVVGVAVVRRVRDAPAVVRIAEAGVDHVADRVVEPVAVAEVGLVAALMADDPQAEADGALHDGVREPDGGAEHGGVGADDVQEGVGGEADGGEEDEVAGDVVPRQRDAGLEHLGGHRVAQVGEREGQLAAHRLGLRGARHGVHERAEEVGGLGRLHLGLAVRGLVVVVWVAAAGLLLRRVTRVHGKEVAKW
eukprot:CAMPEP_0174855724 /NCGR_PEP_ID=MMETSP1114-20130205/34040_1 /TAXON_ID=312471 /ORGANISM="Neobodo designis, Strain CCAP 1951/1" /LENGTH=539 /DNA_ID=CAMNT_0016090485 /DNA_START=525 /DNA_END=2141 /DNA_ORIENTATION=-